MALSPREDWCWNMASIFSGSSAGAIVALLFCLAPSPILALDTAVPAPLFAKLTALEMEFELDFDKLCRNPSRGQCEDVPATIYYRNNDGTRVRIDVRVRTRGRWRKDSADCAFPALFIYFNPSQVEGTLFDSQTMLPFTTHCKNHSKTYQRYTMLEYLAHRYYQLLTDASLNVRLTHTTFRDTGKDRQIRRYGFFIEHFQSTATRLNAEYIDEDFLDPRETNATELATLSVFQYMISNLDWSVLVSHNIALFRRDNGTVLAIPYDFDYSGFVNAEYATPPAKLHRLRNVRARLYRGFCRPEIDWDDVFGKFHAIRSEVMQMAEDIPAVGNVGRSEAKRFLNKFFATIDSADKRQRRIIDKCRKLPAPKPG